MCHRIGRRQQQTSAQLTEHWAHNTESVGHLLYVGVQERQKWESGATLRSHRPSTFLLYWSVDVPIKIKQDVGCELRWGGLANTAASAEKWYVWVAAGGVHSGRGSLWVCVCPPSSLLGSVLFRWSHLITRSLFWLFFVDFVQSCLRSSMKKGFIKANSHRSTLNFYQQTGHLLGLLWLEAAYSNHCVNRRLFSKQAFSETKQHAPNTLFVFSHQGNNCFTCQWRSCISSDGLIKCKAGEYKLWCLMTDEGSGESVSHFKQTSRSLSVLSYFNTGQTRSNVWYNYDEVTKSAFFAAQPRHSQRLFKHKIASAMLAHLGSSESHLSTKKLLWNNSATVQITKVGWLRVYADSINQPANI